MANTFTIQGYPCPYCLAEKMRAAEGPVEAMVCQCGARLQGDCWTKEDHPGIFDGSAEYTRRTEKEPKERTYQGTRGLFQPELL